MIRSSNRSIRLPLLLALSLATFVPFIGRREITTSHEARVIQTARQMAESGWPWNARMIDVPRPQLTATPDGQRLRAAPDGSAIAVNPWIIPVMNGQIRLQKPPLPYWCTAILYRLFGFSQGASRIIPALLGAVAVLLVWDLARSLNGRISAWYASLVWISTHFIIDEFRKAMADPYLAFFTLAAVWAWIRAIRATRPSAWIITFYAMLGLGMLSKGPIILAFVPVILIVHHLTYARRSVPHPAPDTGRPAPRAVAGWRAHAVGVLLVIAIALPWCIAVVQSVPNAIELWRYESIGALSDKVENARPWWFYPPNLVLITLPWTPLGIMGIVYAIRFRRQRRRLFALAASLVIIIIFSLSHAKKNAYLLPLMPLLAIITAQGLTWMTVIFRPNPRHRPVRVPVLRATVLAVALSIAIQIFFRFDDARDNQRSPKVVAAAVRRMVQERNNLALLTSRLPDEVSVYLPLERSEPSDADQYLLILDDRRGEAESIAHGITTTPAGAVVAVEHVSTAHLRGGKRWRIFKLTVALGLTSRASPATPG